MHQNWKHTYFVSLFFPISNSNCFQIAEQHQPKWTPKLNKMDINSWKGKMFCLWDFLRFDFYAIEFILKKEKRKSHNDWNRKGSALPESVPINEKCVGSSPFLWLPQNYRQPHQVSRSYFLNWMLEVSVQPVPRALFIAIFPSTDCPGWCLPTLAWFFPIAGRTSCLLSCSVARRTNADMERWAGRGLEGQRTDSRVFRFLSPALLPPLCSESMPPTHARWSHLSPQYFVVVRGLTHPHRFRASHSLLPPQQCRCPEGQREANTFTSHSVHGAASEASP